MKLTQDDLKRIFGDEVYSARSVDGLYPLPVEIIRKDRILTQVAAVRGGMSRRLTKDIIETIQDFHESSGHL